MQEIDECLFGAHLNIHENCGHPCLRLHIASVDILLLVPVAC